MLLYEAHYRALDKITHSFMWRCSKYNSVVLAFRAVMCFVADHSRSKT
jgi:hypothetical protein